MPKGLRTVLLVFLVSFLFLATSPPRGEHAATQGGRVGQDQIAPRPAPQTKANQEDGSVALEGCLTETADGFALTTETSRLGFFQDYRIIAPPPFDLRRYNADEVRIIGSLEESADQISIHMRSIKRIRRQVLRSPVLGVSDWPSYKSAEYGLVVQYPPLFKPVTPDSVGADSNFVNADGVVNLLTLEIQREVYPNTMFAGGSLSVSVSDNISNATVCHVFRYYAVKSVGVRTVHGVTYSETSTGDAAGGTGYSHYYFHTFQNGRCYEAVVDLAVGSVGALVQPCLADLVNQNALVDALLPKISFFTPTHGKSVSPSNHDSAPTVTLFRIEPDTKSVASMTTVKLSWSATEADYVQINLDCPQGVYVNPQALTPGQPIDCSYDNRGYNLTAEGFAAVNIDNLSKIPVSLVLTLQPFSDGIGDPKWSSTITLIVNPQ
jgi:hypothetical protein